MSVLTQYRAAGPLVLSFLVQNAWCSPLEARSTPITQLTSSIFPDPAIFQDNDGTWYAFATNNQLTVTTAEPTINVQVARSSGGNSGPWKLLSNDLLPTPGAWSNGSLVWAPEVRFIAGRYVLYYSAVDAGNTNQHCVGYATANSVLGPYTAAAASLFCPRSQGGAIDASAYQDVDGTWYIVYKIDGNAIGNGGSCGNTVAPIVPTPIMIQKMQADGVTPNGSPVQILDRSDADGPLIEAPNLILVNGVYFVFFSSNCYTSSYYDTSYATASSVMGPYTKSSAPLLQTNNPYGVTSPGSAQATKDGSKLLFHANCAAGRCLYETALTYSGTTISVGAPVSPTSSSPSSAQALRNAIYNTMSKINIWSK